MDPLKKMQEITAKVFNKDTGNGAQIDKILEAKDNEELVAAIAGDVKFEGDKVETKSNNPVLALTAEDAQKAGVGKHYQACAPLVPLVMAAIGAIMALFTSCTSDPSVINNDIDVGVTINVKQNYEKLEGYFETLIGLIENGQIKDQEQWEATIQLIKDVLTELKKAGETNEKILSTIIENLQKQNMSLEAIVNILVQQGQSLNDIVKALVALKTDTTTIVQLLQENGKDMKEIISLLKAQGATLADILLAVNGNTEAIAELSANNKVISDQLAKISVQINNLDGNNKDLLNAILVKIDELKANQADLTKVEGMMAEMLKLLAQMQDDNKQVADEQKEFMQAILKAVKKLDADTQKNLTTIINNMVAGNEVNNAMLSQLTAILKKMNQMDNTQKEFFNKILASMGKLDSNTQAALAKILEAINNNTEVAKGTYDLVAQLLEKVDKLGAKADTIVEVVAEMATGQKVSLGKIEQMLSELLTQTRANGAILADGDSKLGIIMTLLEGMKNGIENGETVDLTSIEKMLAELLGQSEKNGGNLSLIATMLQGIKNNFAELQSELGASYGKIYDKLDEILKKIPDGCNCDITVIIERLDTIIEKMNDGDQNNNEGILDDLDNLFGDE